MIVNSISASSSSDAPARNGLKTSKTFEDLAHLSLDVGGLIPGIGEAFDLTNALWYLRSGQPLNGAFSLISMIPAIGDLIGKGGKFGMWLSKIAPRSTAGAVKYGPKIQQIQDKFKPLDRL